MITLRPCRLDDASDLTLFLTKSQKPKINPFRDGLERVEVPETGTLGELKSAIRDKLGIPGDDISLSQDPKLVMLCCVMFCVSVLSLSSVSLYFVFIDNLTI